MPPPTSPTGPGPTTSSQPTLARSPGARARPRMRRGTQRRFPRGARLRRLRKAERLAAERGVSITTVQADLGEFVIRPGHWAGIVLRLPLHASVVQGLRVGGVLLLEAYTPAQIGRGTGGPPDPDWMMSLDRLKDELAGLEWVVAEEKEREVREGSFHTGLASVVQFVGRRVA